jgi:hypothetical protein
VLDLVEEGFEQGVGALDQTQTAARMRRQGDDMIP